MAESLARGRPHRWPAGVICLLTCVVAGCSDGLVAGTPTVLPFDPREAFGAFARPAQPWDGLPDRLTLPELGDPDTRKIGSWPGTDVYIAYGAPGTICLSVDSSPPWSSTGGTVCAPAIEAAANGTAMFSVDDPAEAQGVILIPNNATATIDRGTFVASGIGVIGIRTDTPPVGIAATLTFPDGHTSHFDFTAPG